MEGEKPSSYGTKPLETFFCWSFDVSFRDGQFFSLAERFVHEERWEDLLSNVLATLNGDGGHYQVKHGTAEAAANGLDRFFDLVGEADRLEFENKQLRAALQNAHDIIQAALLREKP